MGCSPRWRIRKKYACTFFIHADIVDRPLEVIECVRELPTTGVRFTKRAERRLCTILRRSGQRILHVPRHVVRARLAQGLDPMTGGRLPRT